MKPLCLARGALVGVLCIGQFSCASPKSFYNDKALVLSSWSGRYRHVSGEFELLLQQFAEDSLAADIVRVPESSQQDVFAGFFASIEKDVAVSRDRTDPDCRFELRRLKEGIEFSDLCHPVGYHDVGLYKPVEGEVALKRVMK